MGKPPEDGEVAAELGGPTLRSAEKLSAWNDPEVKSWLTHVSENLVPMVQSSALSICVYDTDPPDPQNAMEVGYMVLMDKPIIVTAVKGAKVPEKLRRVADQIVEFDPGDHEGNAIALAKAIQAIKPEVLPQAIDQVIDKLATEVEAIDDHRKKSGD